MTHEIGIWNVEEFVELFKKLIKEYEDEIIKGRGGDSIIELEKRRKKPEWIIKNLLRVKISRGYRFINLLKNFEKGVNNRWEVDFFRSKKGKELLKEYLKKAGYQKNEEEYKKLEEHLFSKLDKEDIRKWIENSINKKDSDLEKILPGNKSRNIFLRDYYSFKYVPIDIHERRFLIRTGIFFIIFLQELIHQMTRSIMLKP